MPGPTVDAMNQGHLDVLASEEWRQTLRDHALPFAFGRLSAAELGDDVLEVGPGPGLTTDLLGPQVPRLTSVEIDPALARSLADRTAGTNVEVVEADGAAMPFEDRRFSGAVTFAMLHHVPTVEQQDAVLADVRRVLRQGGLLVASDSVASEDLARFHDGDTYNPIDPSTLEARLTAAGYDDIDIAVNEYAWSCRARRSAAT
jgi:SAM-dependent methyltransferase